MAVNFTKFLKDYWNHLYNNNDTEITINPTEGNDSDQSGKFWYNEIKALKVKHPTNITCAYLNVNTIPNKLDRLMGLIDRSLDIFCIAETKIDASFPTDQFIVPGYHKPFHMDGIRLKKLVVVY